jgi:hypothetical protein
VSPDGLVHGVLDPMHYNRPQVKDDTMPKEVKKNRPIEEYSKQPMVGYDGERLPEYTG